MSHNPVTFLAQLAHPEKNSLPMTIYLHKERAQIITLTMKRMRCEPAGGLAFWCL